MNKLQKKISELAALRENWTLMADMMPADFIDAVKVEIQRQDTRIAELEAENAKLRGVIGEIPEGNMCIGCNRAKKKPECDAIFLRDWCILFQNYIVNDKYKCADCLAAFPDGNKGE